MEIIGDHEIVDGTTYVLKKVVSLTKGKNRNQRKKNSLLFYLQLKSQWNKSTHRFIEPIICVCLWHGMFWAEKDAETNIESTDKICSMRLKRRIIRTCSQQKPHEKDLHELTTFEWANSWRRKSTELEVVTHLTYTQVKHPIGRQPFREKVRALDIMYVPNTTKRSVTIIRAYLFGWIYIGGLLYLPLFTHQFSAANLCGCVGNCCERTSVAHTTLHQLLALNTLCLADLFSQLTSHGWHIFSRSKSQNYNKTTCSEHTRKKKTFAYSTEFVKWLIDESKLVEKNRKRNSVEIIVVFFLSKVGANNSKKSSVRNVHLNDTKVVKRNYLRLRGGKKSANNQTK